MNGPESAESGKPSDCEDTTKKIGTKIKKPKKRQIANRAYHRMLSIQADADRLQSMLTRFHAEVPQSRLWPVLPNERCGQWYVDPEFREKEKVQSCYFKSTDGHKGIWNVSLKRLNLGLIRVLAASSTASQSQGCFIVDSSVRKVMPDSFARTIPLWACVMNRIRLVYAKQFETCGVQSDLPHPGFWDTELRMPQSLVLPGEHDHVCQLLDERVQTLHQSGAIVDPTNFLRTFTKPLRPHWMVTKSASSYELLDGSTLEDLQDCRFFHILCINPSTYRFVDPTGTGALKNAIEWITHNSSTALSPGFYYTSGAADDEESWARHLSPSLFWKSISKNLASMSEDEADEAIDSIVQQTIDEQQSFPRSKGEKGAGSMDQIGSLPIWIGSRKCGRPPECWEHFDCVLNVTDQEYSTYNNCQVPEGKYYLQMPVAEGKKDKTELERWLPVGWIFLWTHICRISEATVPGRILVHCNQGKDRSVATVLSFVMLACPVTFPLRLNPQVLRWEMDMDTSSSYLAMKKSETSVDMYGSSGLRLDLVDNLLSTYGREDFLRWIHSQLSMPMDKPLASKDSLRIGLHLIRQDREVAEPSRSTMQKLNRFFMSSPLYRN